MPFVPYCYKSSNAANQLGQKLAAFETAIAKLATLKQELRAGTEQARRDIRNAIDDQMAALRDREQELMDGVEMLLSKGEDALATQSEELLKAIGLDKNVNICKENILGACKQLLEDKIQIGDFELEAHGGAVTELLNRMNAIESCEAGSPRPTFVLFQAEPFECVDLRREIAAFGRLVETGGTMEAAKCAFGGDSSVNQWLATHVRKSNSTTSTLAVQEQHQLDNLRGRLNSLSACSFEVINSQLSGSGNSPPTANANSQLCPNSVVSVPNPFLRHFNELNRLPSEHWLKSPTSNAGPKNVVKQTITSSELADAMREIHLKAGNQRTLPSARNLQRKRPNADTTANWAHSQTDFSSWLKQSSHHQGAAVPPSAAAAPVVHSAAAVISSILASAPEQWLFAQSFSTAAEPDPPRAPKIVRKWTGGGGAENDTRFCTVIEASGMENKDSEQDQGMPAEEVPNSVAPFLPCGVINERDTVEEALKRMTVLFREDKHPSRGAEKEAQKKEELCPFVDGHKGCGPTLNLPADPAHWLAQYPAPKQTRPMNEMAGDLSSWESVLGWKSILEKIHASGEDVWLAPSSRPIPGN